MLTAQVISLVNKLQLLDWRLLPFTFTTKFLHSKKIHNEASLSSTQNQYGLSSQVTTNLKNYIMVKLTFSETFNINKLQFNIRPTSSELPRRLKF